MQTVLEQGSIDKPLTFDVGLIQLSLIPVCSLNTCNISVKLCRGFALQCFSFIIIIIIMNLQNSDCVYMCIYKKTKTDINRFTTTKLITLTEGETVRTTEYLVYNYK